jgi:HAD superfamily hydrolase (TIGR01549 family)
VKTITAHSREVLAVLHKRYPMVLVSNFYGNIATVLKEFGLDIFFKSIVESAEVGIRKPNPRIFTIGVERLGLKPEEVVVVGDSFYKDIEPALAAGCHAIWMKGEGWTKKEYDESIPDKVITDLEELINVE